MNHFIVAMCDFWQMSEGEPSSSSDNADGCHTTVSVLIRGKDTTSQSCPSKCSSRLYESDTRPPFIPNDKKRIALLSDTMMVLSQNSHLTSENIADSLF